MKQKHFKNNFKGDFKNMKLHKLLIALFVFSLVLGASATTFAQDEEPWKEITEEQYLKQKEELTQQVNNLKSDINALDNEVKALNADLKDKDAKVKKAEEELKGLCDAAAYKAEFAKVEKIVMDKDKSGVKVEDAEKMVAQLEASKCKCMGDYQTRLAKIKKELDAWKNPPQKADQYTVVKGDCLWKISNKFYKEPKAWFAIWEKNKEGVVSAPPKVAKTIKNPNLIYPGQVLRIPALTDAEKKAAVLKTNKYKNKWVKRVKKTDTTEVKKDEVKKDEKKEVKKEDKKDVKKEVKKEEKKEVKKEEKKK